MTSLDGREPQTVQRLLGQDAVMTDAFYLEQFPIDLLAEVAQVGEVIDRLADVEVHRIVDGGLRAQGMLFLEVLLDVRGLVFDMQARLHAIGDHAGPIAKGRWGRGAGEA